MEVSYEDGRKPWGHCADLGADLGDTKIISVCRVSKANDDGAGGSKTSQGGRNHKFFVVALPGNA